jgi:hypothetical protein
MQTPPPVDGTSFRRCAALCHVVVAAFFGALAIWITYPLALELNTHVPGAGAGDNLAFLWNAWWFQEWAHGRAPALLWTDRLFAPYGTSLVLHTHTILPSALAALVPLDSIVAQHNVILIAGLALNGIATYALAFSQVRQVIPSLAAGLLFASGGYVYVHLLGHFNLVHAWVLPLAILAWLRFIETPTAARGVVLGVAMAAVVYTDYYYSVYVLLILVVWQAHRSWAFGTSFNRRPWTTWTKIVIVLIVLLACLIGAILAFGDLSFDVGGGRVSLRNTRNPLTVLYALSILVAIYSSGVRVSARRRAPERRAGLQAWLIAGLSATLLTLPIVVAAVQLIRQGGYVSQRILWRSSPAGVDFATVFLGHPWHTLTGNVAQSLVGSLAIDLVEQSAWVGLIALFAIWWSRPIVATERWRMWAALGIVFTLLAAGPFLRFAGVDTGLPMPWAFLRYVPVLSNARIPGRALVVVALAVSVLLAFALTGLRRWPRIIVLAALTIEMSVAPVPLYMLPQMDAVDRTLRDDPGAAVVAELPTGVRDGFGDVGRFDHRALVHQMHHGKPLIGGFVARLSPRVAEAYRAGPILNALIEGHLPSERLETLGAQVPFIVVNTDAVVDAERLRADLQSAGYRLVVTAGTRELFRHDRP